MTVVVRPAGPGDAPALARLRWAFRTEVGGPNEDEAAFVARAEAWLAERLAGPSWHAWVAEADDGTLVGTVFLQLVEKVPNPVDEAEHLGYLTNTYVAPEHRGTGVGGRLAEAALAAAPRTTVLWPQERSVGFWRRHGFGPPRSVLERQP